MRLAESCDLPGIVAEKVDLPTSIGSNPAGKLSAIVAGMVAGADSIDDLCDMRVHVVSESVDWRSADVDDVTSGQCPRPVPTVTCVAGNGRVRSSWESPRAPAPSGGHR